MAGTYCISDFWQSAVIDRILLVQVAQGAEGIVHREGRVIENDVGTASRFLYN